MILKYINGIGGKKIKCNNEIKINEINKNNDCFLK